MSGPLRAIWRLSRATLHLLHGLLVATLQLPRLDAAGRAQRVQWWSAKLLRVLGVQWRVEGQPHGAAALVVANHISWLDIAAIHAACPHARFVSKADVRHWPLIGWLVAAGGTLFIERERKRDALRVVHQMAEALAAGDTVAVFPEGTTSDGNGTLPFHANLLQAAIAAQVPVQPVALRFSEPGHAVSPAVMFVGTTTLVQSMWAVAAARGLCVHVALLPVMPTAQAERRALAVRLRECVDARLALPADAAASQAAARAAQAGPVSPK